MLVGQYSQRIDLSGCANQPAQVFIIYVQEWWADIAGNTINAHDVPLRLFLINLDCQPVANFQIGKDIEQVISDHNGVLITGCQPAPGGDDGVDQCRCGRGGNKQDLRARSILLVGNESASVLRPAFHAAHSWDLLRHCSHFIVAVIASKGNINICQEIPLDIFDGLVKGCPKIVNTNKNGSGEHKGNQR